MAVHQVREQIALYLLRQGPVFSYQGKAGRELRDSCGYQGAPGVFSRQLTGMELDGEVTREVNHSQTYAIGLTEFGIEQYRYLLKAGEEPPETIDLTPILDFNPVLDEAPVEPLIPEPDPEAPDPFPGPEPEPEPVAAQTSDRVAVLSEAGPAIDYDRLVKTVRKLVVDEQAKVTSENTELKHKLARALEEAQRLRGKYQHLEERVVTLEADKQELRKRLKNAGGLSKASGANRSLGHLDTQDLLTTARKQGWEVENGGSGHYKLVSPQGQAIAISRTPSDYRSTLNERQALRQAGLNI